MDQIKIGKFISRKRKKHFNIKSLMIWIKIKNGGIMYYNKNIDEIYENLKSNKNGLEQSEVNRRLKKMEKTFYHVQKSQAY